MARRWASRVIYYWADRKYGVKARGPVSNTLNEQQRYMLEQWHKWMRIKNRVGNPIGRKL